MTLLVDLYKNSSVQKRKELGIGLAKSKQPNYSPTIDIHEYLGRVQSECHSDISFAESILDSALNPRTCFDLLGASIDSYFNIYTLNIIDKFQDHYIVVYSLQDLLPLVLNHMCGCDIEAIMQINDLDVISRDILEMKFDSDISIRSFVGLDKNLDEFIQTICIEDNSEFAVLSNFMTNVNRNMTNMLKYIAIAIESNSAMSFISIDKSKILFRSMREDIDEVICKYNDIEFKLNPLITKESFDYFKKSKDFKYGELLCF